MNAYALFQHNCLVLELLVRVQIPFVMAHWLRGGSGRRLKVLTIALEHHIDRLGLRLESSAGVLLTGQKDQCRGCCIPFQEME